MWSLALLSCTSLPFALLSTDLHEQTLEGAAPTSSTASSPSQKSHPAQSFSLPLSIAMAKAMML
ncbi:hypothetical protein M758_UG015500 [Ceratodon purpureus]|nr:hypothetical protein M758_UG015500 [Ceratodon purpureus]